MCLKHDRAYEDRAYLQLKSSIDGDERAWTKRSGIVKRVDWVSVHIQRVKGSVENQSLPCGLVKVGVTLGGIWAFIQRYWVWCDEAG